MPIDARWSFALTISIFLSIAVLVRAIATFMSAEELVLHAYVGFTIGALLTLYELPAIVAYRRNHHQSLAILLLNILLGWTIVGWIIALVWACASKHTAVSPTRIRRVLPIRTRVVNSLVLRYQRVLVSKQRAKLVPEA